MRSLTATARLAGIVHGVVVHTASAASASPLSRSVSVTLGPAP